MWAVFTCKMSTVIFNANFNVLDDIREFVAEFARRANFSDKEIYSIQLAADEASSNIIEHAYAGVDEGKIEIECHVDDDKLTIIMRDQGKPFNPATVPEPNLSADLSDRQIGGLGMYLMRKLMDEVTYKPSAQMGNVLKMTKRKGDNA
jgi:serine/threonine-protein kinase RsbW